MSTNHAFRIPQLAQGTRGGSLMADRITPPGVNVVRQGRMKPFLGGHPAGSRSAGQWGGIALEKYKVPSVFVPRHEHPEHFLHVVLSGTVKYEVKTKGQNLRFSSQPGTIFLLPRGTEDEINWGGPTQRLVVSIHPRLLTNALDETAHLTDVDLTDRWDLIDEHISALLHEMAADLDDGSPAGPIYGESLANALGVYLLKRYAVRPLTPFACKGGLPGHRLKRVLDYIAVSLDGNISLTQLSAIAGMSPHYFSELFKQSTGRTPHTYVLHQRIERAKQRLCDPKSSIIDAGLDAGFENPSHFARVFRRLVGTTPSRFRAESAIPKMLPVKADAPD
jgi:AraC family transcriptional regulator